LVTSATEALPDNPDLLKAMLLAERAESERLRQIIKELQRHRFGRRAETLPEEQLQLGLEDVEQIEAAGHAESEAKVPAERQERAARRRANRGALPAHLPRIETLVDIASTICPGCSGQLADMRATAENRGCHPLLPILTPTLAPCAHFTDACSRQCTWEPSRGHIPRGFGGGKGALDQIRLVVVTAEPRAPADCERYQW
jgi:hypothetical protein